MFNVPIIMVGICISVWILSQADIKITLTHNYPQPVDKPVDNLVVLTQEDVDKAHDDAQPTTFDDVLKSVQEILGGTYGEE